jgi:hypothetical protein
MDERLTNSTGLPGGALGSLLGTVPSVSLPSHGSGERNDPPGKPEAFRAASAGAGDADATVWNQLSLSATLTNVVCAAYEFQGGVTHVRRSPI